VSRLLFFEVEFVSRSIARLWRFER
jgi:hypothetical protein